MINIVIEVSREVKGVQVRYTGGPTELIIDRITKPIQQAQEFVKCNYLV